MAIRCLIVDELHDSISSLLTSIKVEFDYLPELSRDEIIKVLPKYDGLIIRSKTKVDKELIENANLKFIARAGAGIDNLDIAYLQAKNIAILNAPEGNRDAVGEHTVGLILNLLHNISRSHLEVHQKRWLREVNRGWELGNKTVGIYGLGNSGSAVAEKLSGFGCKIIAYDKYLSSGPYSKYLTDLDDFFERTDILSLHIPLTSETLNLFSAEYFNQFKNPIMLINTSRGEIANLASIRRAVETGKIINAGLDVLDCENFSKMNKQQLDNFNWLKESGKVLFTPHIAGWTYESYRRINVVLVEKIAAFLDH